MNEGAKQEVEVSMATLSIPTTEWGEKVKATSVKDPYTVGLISQHKKTFYPKIFQLEVGYCTTNIG